MSAQKSADLISAVSKAFSHAFDMDDRVGQIKDLLLAIDAIARADVEDPCSSAITRMVQFGEKALAEIEAHRDGISRQLRPYADLSTVLHSATARGAREGAAA